MNHFWNKCYQTGKLIATYILLSQDHFKQVTRKVDYTIAYALDIVLHTFPQLSKCQFQCLYEHITKVGH